MTYETILFTEADGVATLTLNRPEVMNALNSTMRAEITRAARFLPKTARCLVLTGTGRAFCSGQDLGDAGAALDLAGVLRDEYEPMIHALRETGVPVIAAVNGVAAGAGANLALIADVVIATRSASFVQAFTRIGLLPDAGGTHFLPRLVGHARALGAMLFADRISADQAAEWGMIWESVPDEEFAATVAARAGALAAGPTRAYLAIREAVAASAANDLKAQLQVEARLQGALGDSADFREGVVAFHQKRAPVFTGS